MKAKSRVFEVLHRGETGPLEQLAGQEEKGFDGLEPDNIDGYANNTGFPLTYQDQLNYNTFLANEAHACGLSISPLPPNRDFTR